MQGTPGPPQGPYQPQQPRYPQPPYQQQPPVKVCRNCGAQSQTFAPKCPSCGKSYKSKTGRNILIIALGVLLGGTLLIVGCVALVASGVDEANEEQKKQGITLEQFRSVRQGTTQDEIEADFGKPEDAQEFENEGIDTTEPERSSCIYYPEKGKGIGEGRSFQLCFTEGKLDSKNAY